MKRVLWLLPCLAMALATGDVTGKWTGTVEVADTDSGTTINTPVRAEFEQKSNVISGRIGRREEEHTETIRNGRLEGNRFSFEVTSAETVGVIRFDLTIEGDRMEGDMKGNVDSGPITGKVHLSRQPQ